MFSDACHARPTEHALVTYEASNWAQTFVSLSRCVSNVSSDPLEWNSCELFNLPHGPYPSPILSLKSSVSRVTAFRFLFHITLQVSRVALRWRDDSMTGRNNGAVKERQGDRVLMWQDNERNERIMV